MNSRPDLASYYEQRTPDDRLSQGDILNFPVTVIEGLAPAVVLTATGEEESGNPEVSHFPRLLSKPLVEGEPLSIVITPTAALRMPGTSAYGAKWISLAAIRSVAYMKLTPQLVQQAIQTDDLSAAMYLPPHDGRGIPEAVILFESVITVTLEFFLTADLQPTPGWVRLTQLQNPAVRQLQRQLIRFYTGSWPSDDHHFHIPPD